MRGGRLKSQKAKNYYYNCSVCGEAILGSFRLAGTMQEKAQQNRGLARFIQKARALARVVGVVTGGPRAQEGRLPSPPLVAREIVHQKVGRSENTFPPA